MIWRWFCLQKVIKSSFHILKLESIKIFWDSLLDNYLCYLFDRTLFCVNYMLDRESLHVSVDIPDAFFTNITTMSNHEKYCHMRCMAVAEIFTALYLGDSFQFT